MSTGDQEQSNLVGALADLTNVTEKVPADQESEVADKVRALAEELAETYGAGVPEAASEDQED